MNNKGLIKRVVVFIDIMQNYLVCAEIFILRNYILFYIKA